MYLSGLGHVWDQIAKIDCLKRTFYLMACSEIWHHFQNIWDHIPDKVSLEGTLVLCQEYMPQGSTQKQS